MKTEAEIQEMADRAAESVTTPIFIGMSYEDGVRAAIDWVLGNMEEDETPLD